MTELSTPGFSPISGRDTTIEQQDGLSEKTMWCSDRFLIGCRLGAGTHSQVFVAKEKRTGFVCALKVIKKRNLESEKILQNQLRNEIEIQRGLTHKNIVQLFAYFYDKSRIYLVLEYCPGGQLFRQIQGRAMSEDKTASYIKQLLSAVEYLHEKYIIHRDIKPENILLDKKGKLRLADFGWSVYQQQGDPRRNTICGTLDYMAPELLKEHSSYSFPVDIWAVGIVTHELLTGSPPFAKLSATQTCDRILNTEITIKTDSLLSITAVDFIRKSLTKSESQRLTASRALQHSFVRSYSD